MQITKEQINNLLVFLTVGKFSVNADEAGILATLKQDLTKAFEALQEIKEVGTEITPKTN